MHLPAKLRPAAVCLLVIALWLPCGTPGIAARHTDTTFNAGVTYFGTNEYVEFRAGNYPIILSAPHGGEKKPSSIPDRTWGSTINDANTMELARYFASEVTTRTGKHPYIIINRLARIKLDANRDSLEAAQDNPEALTAWRQYHFFIDYSRRKVVAQYGKGLYIDLHGHGHDIQQIEIGYLLSAADLSRTDAQLDATTAYRNRSSIRNLATGSSLSFSGLLRGPLSLGNIFNGKGFPAVPSPLTSGPGSNPYFDGGFNTELYGSRDGGTIDGVQFEINRVGIRDNDANTRAFAKILDQVVSTFLLLHYPGLTGVTSQQPAPKAPAYLAVYPDPFVAATTIEVTLPEMAFAPDTPFTLNIYTIMGQLAAVVYSGPLQQGTNRFTFTAPRFATGIYFCRLQAPGFTEIKKMLLLN